MMNNLSRQDHLPIIFSSPPFQVATIAIFFTAIFYDQKELAILCMFLIFMSVGAVVWSNYSTRGLHCSLILKNTRTFPGETPELYVNVHNKKHLPVWLKLEVRIDQELVENNKNHIAVYNRQNFTTDPLIPKRWNPKNSFFSKERTVLFGEGLLFGKQNTPLTWVLNPRQRGIYQLGPLYLKAGDLLGLSSKEVELNEENYIAVYPNIAVLKNLPLPLSELFGIPGAKSPVVDPVYPVATRDYHPGSPSRHIHWKTSARFGKLHEKVFEPTTRKKVVIAIDVDQFSSDLERESFETLLETATAMAIKFENNGVPFGLCSNGIVTDIKGNQGDGVILPAANSSSHLSRFLDYLAGITTLSGTKTTSDLLHALHMTRETTLLVFTYCPAAGNKTLEQIAVNFSSRVINIIASDNTPISKDVFFLNDLIHSRGLVNE